MRTHLELEILDNGTEQNTEVGNGTEQNTDDDHEVGNKTEDITDRAQYTTDEVLDGVPKTRQEIITLMINSQQKKGRN